MKSRKATKKEKEWLESIKEMGCIVCFNEGYGFTPNAIHHISGKVKPDCHLNTIPLCGIHHQVGDYGTALHQGRVAFEKRYGTQAELLKQIQQLIGNQDG